MKQKGFTIVELLVVVGIIALLTTLALASFNYARNKSKREKTRHDITVIHNAIVMLASDSNEWPGHQEVLELGGAVPNNEYCADGCANSLASDMAGLEGTDGNFSGWNGPYLNETLEDPWGNEYFFDTDYEINIDDEPCDGGGACITAAVVGSYGPDGSGNNQYNSDDIIKILVK